MLGFITAHSSILTKIGKGRKKEKVASKKTRFSEKKKVKLNGYVIRNIKNYNESQHTNILALPKNTCAYNSETFLIPQVHKQMVQFQMYFIAVLLKTV